MTDSPSDLKTLNASDLAGERDRDQFWRDPLSLVHLMYHLFVGLGLWESGGPKNGVQSVGTALTKFLDRIRSRLLSRTSPPNPSNSA